MNNKCPCDKAKSINPRCHIAGQCASEQDDEPSNAATTEGTLGSVNQAGSTPAPVEAAPHIAPDAPTAKLPYAAVTFLQQFDTGKVVLEFMRAQHERICGLERQRNALQADAQLKYEYYQFELDRANKAERQLAAANEKVQKLMPYVRHGTVNKVCAFMKHSEYPCNCGLAEIEPKEPT